MLRIVCISDTHLRTFDMPDGDILVFAGDALMNGDLPELSKFLGQWHEWCTKFKHSVFVAGNHDWPFQLDSTLAVPALTKYGTHYLRDSEVVIDGLKFYGSPWQPRFYDWAFNIDRNSEKLKACWDLIPNDTDVLITHTPVYGICDMTKDYYNRPGGHAGCERLRTRIDELPNLKLSVSGHIHPAYGQTKINNTIFVNASVCNEQYKAVNKPIVIEL